jgi:hypothetical protein
VGDARNAYKISARKPQESKRFENLSVDRKIILI